VKRLVLAVALVSIAASSAASAFVARRYHERTLAEFRAALREAKRGEVDRGKLEACTAVMNNSCAMQWGAPCVGKKLGKAKWE
jgi:hypothetical protein